MADGNMMAGAAPAPMDMAAVQAEGYRRMLKVAEGQRDRQAHEAMEAIAVRDEALERLKAAAERIAGLERDLADAAARAEQLAALVAEKDRAAAD